MKLPGPGACQGEEGLGKPGPTSSKEGCLGRNKRRNKAERGMCTISVVSAKLGAPAWTFKDQGDHKVQAAPTKAVLRAAQGPRSRSP